MAKKKSVNKFVPFGGIPLDLVDGIGQVAEGSNDLMRALRCARVTVVADCDGGVDFIAGTLAVLLSSAEHMSARADDLYDDAEHLLHANSKHEKAAK